MRQMGIGFVTGPTASEPSTGVIRRRTSATFVETHSIEGLVPREVVEKSNPVLNLRRLRASEIGHSGRFRDLPSRPCTLLPGKLPTLVAFIELRERYRLAEPFELGQLPQLRVLPERVVDVHAD